MAVIAASAACCVLCGKIKECLNAWHSRQQWLVAGKRNSRAYVHHITRLTATPPPMWEVGCKLVALGDALFLCFL